MLLLLLLLLLILMNRRRHATRQPHAAPTGCFVSRRTLFVGVAMISANPTIITITVSAATTATAATAILLPH
jgi:hypothetical protein